MNYEVILIGGGPVGMMLAGELALAGVKVCVVERLKETTPYSRALTVHPRTLEILDMRGLKGNLMSKGRPLSRGHFAGLDTPLNFSVLDSSSNYTLFLPQSETEKVLEEWALNQGVMVLRGFEAVSVNQDKHGVDVEIEGPDGKSILRALYVVGTDGARSMVRKHAHISFEGSDATFTAILGDAVLSDLPPMSVISRITENGLVSIMPINEQIYRVLMIDLERRHISKDEALTLEEFRSSIIRTAGSDLGLRDVKWMSRFGNATRQAGRYRNGRLFLAGDSAHIHFPAGGQGMNVGLQEAINLGWKLAGAIKGWAPGWLLDSYHDERFPWNTALLRNTQVQTMLMDVTPPVMELRDMLSHLIRIPEANIQLAEQISALDVHYAADAESPSHPLNGKRFKDLSLKLGEGRIINAYQLLRQGEFVLLHLNANEENADSWETDGPLQVVHASLGQSEPDWIDVHTALIRPDGHVAWAVSLSDSDPMQTIKEGIARWCGGPAS
ncbi:MULTISPECIES: monooxygenase [unclassified Paenibacillus]|uniref:monooxygenase n=1 Tax=unclassified Paenibacillus TaxID=185978 RepID=UPI001C117060|nr:MULTISPECIES: monooxygenase [unclassified Paenibacillus]MBU5445170.1 monooxygenase [Paenibacillus sp. MSJ-34]CAH0122441.1 12-dehydrotetracycline 5-monooxygenase/anhydrotetracycline 6-monooxygenase [Paenibacillus sp. CECT 9249]